MNKTITEEDMDEKKNQNEMINEIVGFIGKRKTI